MIPKSGTRFFASLTFGSDKIMLKQEMGAGDG
jgi:hypothetical protein